MDHAQLVQKFEKQFASRVFDAYAEMYNEIEEQINSKISKLSLLEACILIPSVTEHIHLLETKIKDLCKGRDLSDKERDELAYLMSGGLLDNLGKKGEKPCTP